MAACVALHGTTATVGGALPRPIGEGGFETVSYASATASLAAVARRGGRR